MGRDPPGWEPLVYIVRCSIYSIQLRQITCVSSSETQTIHNAYKNTSEIIRGTINLH